MTALYAYIRTSNIFRKGTCGSFWRETSRSICAVYLNTTWGQETLTPRARLFLEDTQIDLHDYHDVRQSRATRTFYFLVTFMWQMYHIELINKLISYNNVNFLFYRWDTNLLKVTQDFHVTFVGYDTLFRINFVNFFVFLSRHSVINTNDI